METTGQTEEPTRFVAHFTDIVRKIDEDLPQYARNAIQSYLDVSDPENATFLSQPDRRDQHQTQWHRWGILTHTRVFLRLFDSIVPQKLEAWDLWEPVQEVLGHTIGGVSKWDLLRISILLHDIGKFAARTRGARSFHFSGHERLSGSIIREDLDLQRYGLTADQIEYIARTAEDHFVLGLVRKRARESGGFTIEFPHSHQFQVLSERIALDHPDDAVEIGVLFLGDSLAKVDENHGPERALSQSPINEAVARAYLQVVFGEERRKRSL